MGSDKAVVDCCRGSMGGDADSGTMIAAVASAVDSGVRFNCKPLSCTLFSVFEVSHSDDTRGADGVKFLGVSSMREDEGEGRARDDDKGRCALGESCLRDMVFECRPDSTNRKRSCALNLSSRGSIARGALGLRFTCGGVPDVKTAVDVVDDNPRVSLKPPCL